MNLEEAKNLFKKNIKSVELGVHNYCNRTCDFCPLSLESVNRRVMKNTIFMSDDIFEGIINQLAEIDFDGRIDFSRYHEPLSHSDFILDKIKFVRENLPNANISINTNSDYINKKFHKQLLDAGVDRLALQAYLKNGVKSYDEDEAFDRINHICDKLGAPRINKEKYRNEEWIVYALPPEYKAKVHARNYWVNGHNRAGTVLDTDYIRTEPCTSMNTGVFIEYDGSMTICCDMLTPELHNKWAVGNLRKQPNIFLNYTSKFYQDFKKRINEARWYPNSPCIKCKRDVRGKQGMSL